MNSNKKKSVEQTITLNYNSTMASNNHLTLTADDIVLLENAIVELSVQPLIFGLSKKLARRLCIKINNWRNIEIDTSYDFDWSINATEMIYLLSSIKVLIYTIPHSFVSERINAHTLFKRLDSLNELSLLEA
jgi:hypothetical protein